MLKNNYILLINKFDKKKRNKNPQTNKQTIKRFSRTYHSYHTEAYIRWNATPKFYFMYCYIENIISKT